MAESDSEWLDSIERNAIIAGSDLARLFALARRGAAPEGVHTKHTLPKGVDKVEALPGWEWMREQAARVAEHMQAPNGNPWEWPTGIAAAIRALPPPPAEGEK